MNIKLVSTTVSARRSVTGWRFTRTFMGIGVALCAMGSNPVPAGAQTLEGIIVLANKTNNTFITSGPSGPAGHLDGAWGGKTILLSMRK